MRVSSLFFASVFISTAQAAVIAHGDLTLVARDACSNGVKVRGSGSISCSGRQCQVCSGGKCCTVTSPKNNSCNSITPYLNIETCTFESSSSSGSSTGGSTSVSTSGSAGSGNSTPAPRPSQTFEDFLRSYFGGPY